MRYHNAVDRTFTPMEELTKQMSRFVIRNLRSVRVPPLTETTSTNITGYAPVAGRKARIPAKGEAKPPPKSPPLVNPPLFSRHATQKVHRGIRLGRAEGLREDPQKGPASPTKAKAKFLLTSFLIGNPPRIGRELTDRKTSPQKSGSPTQTISVKKDRTLNSTRKRDPFHAETPPHLRPKRSGLNGIV